MKFRSLLILVLLTAFGSTSCKKVCDIEGEDTNEGAIITESSTGEKIVFYPSTFTQNWSNHITATHPHANNIEISFDGGQTRQAVNWNQYHVLRNPVKSSCESVLNREVIINTTNQTATYNIDVTNCSACDQQYNLENYVLVPAIPSNYTVSFNVTYTEVD